jgi:hypothetical protein
MANFDRIYDSLHKSEKRKAELEAKIVRAFCFACVFLCDCLCVPM